MSRRIIVSDLHVDTWTDAKVGDSGKSKLQHFLDFLDWCEDKHIDEFIINGDLMDMPPYKGQCVFQDTQSGECIPRAVVNRLVVFGRNVPVTYVHGNHDIGVSGFRSMAEHNISLLRNTSCCYPDYKLEYPGRSTILIEHGHLYDPVILLYIRDLTLRTYIASGLEAFQWAMQRRDVLNPSAVTPPGAQQPVDVEYMTNAYRAIPGRFDPREVAKDDVRGALGHREFMKDWKKIAAELGKPLILANWRRAAEAEMLQYVTDTSHAGKQLTPMVYLTFGHTHRTDKFEGIPLAEGVKGAYFNTGSWAQEVPQGPYLDVDEDGKVWLQDWINEDQATRRL